MSEAPCSYNRRSFLQLTGALSVGVLAPWACAREGGQAGGSSDAERSGREAAKAGAADASPNGLPPRVVGLRSLGGAFRFDPAGLLIQAGDPVHWLNMGDFHTVSAFHPDNAKLLPSEVPLRMPAGEPSYHSGMLGLTAGTQFTHRFETEGVYDYFCQPHYSFGMVGRVVVAGPEGAPTASRPDDGLLEAARGQMPTVETIVGERGVGFEWVSRLNGVLYEMANGRDGRSAAESVAAAAGEDDALRDRLGPSVRDELGAAFDAVVRQASAGDYEAVGREADAAKALLRKSTQNS